MHAINAGEKRKGLQKTASALARERKAARNFRGHVIHMFPPINLLALLHPAVVERLTGRLILVLLGHYHWK